MRLAKKTEHSEQVALFEWAKANEARHLQLGLLFAIPNGGKRHIVTAKKLKASGTKSGIPDIFLPVPRLPYDFNDVIVGDSYSIGFSDEVKFGLFIELKVGKNKPSKNQLWWIHSLRAEGYAVEVCYGFLEAKTAIENYLGLETA